MATAVAVAPAGAVVVGPAPQKSPLDDRLYRTLTLPNGLKVLLISDPALDKAAAALDVSVGHFNDPSHLPGLAHFLEHMLFLGTEKYPDEDSYSGYLAQNAGYSNAYTSCENTNYQFQLVVSKEARDGGGEASPLYEALDRFSQFFLAPLFTEGATERELNAVDSEHEKNLQNDNQRLFQLGQSCANPKHPFSGFGTGSKATLWDEPQANGVDTREALLAFHKKYYSANLMRLCVTSPHSLDLMEKWAVEFFSGIVNSDVQLPAEEYKDVLALTEKETGLTMHVVPIKDFRMIQLSWLTPAMNHLYRSKPSNYVSHLMGHEGKGSLLSVMKERGWADELSAGESLSLENFGFFGVTISLTKEGVDHVDDIVELVYAYLKLIREEGIETWIHEESAALADMGFRFAERVEPFNLVQTLSGRMALYPEEEYLSGAYLVNEFAPQAITDLLDCLTPEKGNLMVVGSFVEGSTDATEKWYGTAYRMEEMPASTVEKWRTVKPDAGLAIPGKNPFIPTKFDLVCEPLGEGEVDMEGPAEIIRSDKFELHFKQDRTFKRPFANVRMILETPIAYSSPRNVVLSTLFISLLKDDLNEFSYDAELAGLGFDLHAVDNGLLLFLSGYNDKMQVLLDAILAKLATFSASRERFSMIYDQWEREWANFDMEQPYRHAMYGVTYLTQTPRWHFSQYLACLRDSKDITVEAVNEYVPLLLEKMRAVLLVHGNCTESWARELCENFEKALSFVPLSQIEQPTRRIVQLPTEFAVVTRKVGLNSDDNNSAVKLSYQIGPRGDFATDVCLELLTAIMNKPAFHVLRTQQQLGYMTFSGIDGNENIRGLYVIIQSTVCDPDELCRRIEAFLVQFRKEDLEDLKASEFENFVDSAVATKLEKDKRLSQRTRRFFNEVDGKTFLYNRAEQEIAALRKVQKADVIAMFDKYIAIDAPERRKIASLVYGCKHPMGEYGAEESQEAPFRVVDDAVAFRLSRPLFPAGGRHSPYVVKSGKFNGPAEAPSLHV